MELTVGWSALGRRAPREAEVSQYDHPGLRPCQAFGPEVTERACRRAQRAIAPATARRSAALCCRGGFAAGPLGGGAGEGAAPGEGANYRGGNTGPSG